MVVWSLAYSIELSECKYLQILHYFGVCIVRFLYKLYSVKVEGRDQESIQSSATPDHMVTKHNKTQHARKPRGQPFPSRRSQGCKEQTR